MDGQRVVTVQLRHAVDSVSGDIHHAAANLGTYGHGNGTESVQHFQPATEAVGGVHGHAAHGIFTDVLLHLQDDVFPVGTLHDEGVVNPRKLQFHIAGRYVEMHIHDRSYDLSDVPCCVGHRFKGLSVSLYAPGPIRQSCLCTPGLPAGFSPLPHGSRGPGQGYHWKRI